MSKYRVNSIAEALAHYAKVVEEMSHPFDSVDSSDEKGQDDDN